MSVGLEHTCGHTAGGRRIAEATTRVATRGGLYCWGYNYYGQLGDGVDFIVHPAPVRVSGQR